MSDFIPNPDQNDEDYYEHYRRDLVQRHICKNGRFLQEVLLVEQDHAKIPPNDLFHETRRLSKEKIVNTNTDYLYSGYPVVVHDFSLNLHPLNHYVVGGGDNPLLQGGLAMATLSLEELLEVSEHSFQYATCLLDFFLASEKRDSNDDLIGFPLRRRKWWHSPKEVSKDELCGFLLGMHFFIKAAIKRGDSSQENRAKNYLKRLANYLKSRDYKPAGSWLFQFPFTRIFKFNLGSSYLSGTTFPDDWPLGTDEIVSALASIYSLFSLDLDFSYKPRDLFRDTLEWWPETYGGATLIDVEQNFYNTAMFYHCMLMIHDNPVTEDIRKDLWGAFKGLFNYFCKDGLSIGQGDAKLNAYFAVLTHAYAKSINKENEVKNHAEDMYYCLSHPSNYWFHGLPLCHLPKKGELPLAEPFWDGKRYQYDGFQSWGEWFTWEHSDSHGHNLNWSWSKTLREIGPSEGLLLNDLVQGEYYYCKPEKGFRVEAAGLGLLFSRILAAYYGLMPKPVLKHDILFNVLPMDGPLIYSEEKVIRKGPSPWLPQSTLQYTWREGQFGTSINK